MQNRWLGVLLVLFLVGPIPNGLAFQNGQPGQARAPGFVEGMITVPNNQSMNRYEILLVTKGGEQVIARTNADVSGHYRFARFVAEEDDIVVRIEGFNDARVTAMFSPNQTSIVNIQLTPRSGTARIPDPFEASVVTIDELSRKYPRKAIDDFSSAQDSKRKGDNARALELLESVVKLSPDFFDAHNLLGSIYQGMDRYRDAEKQYNLARDLSPGSIQPLVNLVTLYLQEAEASRQEGPLVTGVMYDDAIRVLREAGRLEPRNATIFYLAGITSYRARSYPIAEASLNEALSIDPSMGTAHLALANVYIRERKWKDALRQLDTYLAENPRAADRIQVEEIRARVIEQF